MSLGDLGPAAIAFVLIAVVLSVGSDVLSDVRECGPGDNVSSAACEDKTAAYNATTNGLEGLDTFSGWLPTIALVIAAAIVIGVLAFFNR